MHEITRSAQKIMYGTHPFVWDKGVIHQKCLSLRIKWNIQIYTKHQLSNCHPMWWGWRVWHQVQKQIFVLRIVWNGQICTFLEIYPPQFHPRGLGSINDFFVQTLIFHDISSKKVFWYLPLTSIPLCMGNVKCGFLYIYGQSYQESALEIDITVGRAGMVDKYPNKVFC